MPTLNRPLIEKIIHKLETEPELHDQDRVAIRTECGTVCCVAGWAVELSPDARLSWSESRWGDITAEYSVDERGAFVPTMPLAEKLMGISKKVGDSLFLDFGDTDHMIGRLKDLLNEGGK